MATVSGVAGSAFEGRSVVSLPVFLSVILVVRNQAGLIAETLAYADTIISQIANDYEVIVVDNASTDASVRVLKELTCADGLPNLQIYALTKEVDSDTASWVGLENSLGDFAAVIDPLEDDFGFIQDMLDDAVQGADIVFARNTKKRSQGLIYQGACAVFNSLYKLLNGVDLAKEAPSFRMLSRRVVNFLLQHPRPSVYYRHLPAVAGFSRTILSYSSTPRALQDRRLGESVDRGLRLLVSTTRAPMRVVTALSLFGAGSNLLYSIYVVLIGLFKTDVAPGWVSLSLQQSGMFFLISLVLLVLGEYILDMVSLSNEGPPYHVAQEFTSCRLTRRERLNVEVVPAANYPTQVFPK